MGHPFEELSNLVIGAAIDVHKGLGPGFVESIYQKAMEVALRNRGISFERQKEIRGRGGRHPRLDLVAGALVIMELKAVASLIDLHCAQLKSCLKATGLHVGLLLNFNAPTLMINRVVL